MEEVMKGNITWGKNKDSVVIDIMTVKYMKENGKMVNRMVKVN